MTVSSTQQMYVFIAAIATGVAAMVFFDFFRALRKNNANNWLQVTIEDILFWILATILVIYSLYKYNSGEVRLHWLLGMLLGIVLYQITVSKAIVRLFTYLIKLMRQLTLICVKIVLFPIMLTMKLLKKPILVVISPISGAAHFIKKKRRSFKDKCLRHIKILKIFVKKI